MIIVLVGLSSFPTAVHSDPLAIIDSLIDFKEDLFAGKVGDKGAFLVCSGLFQIPIIYRGVFRDSRSLVDFCNICKCFLLKKGIFGKGKCGCPCQKFDVPKCEIRYVQECNYDHYNQQVKLIAKTSNLPAAKQHGLVKGRVKLMEIFSSS